MKFGTMLGIKGEHVLLLVFFFLSFILIMCMLVYLQELCVYEWSAVIHGSQKRASDLVSDYELLSVSSRSQTPVFWKNSVCS